MPFLAFFRLFQTFLKTLYMADLQLIVCKSQKFIKKSDFGPCLGLIQVYETGLGHDLVVKCRDIIFVDSV